MKNKCNDCKHKESSDCLRCIYKPGREDRFEAKEVEILPEKAGELWQYRNSESYAHTFKDGDDIYFLSDGCSPKLVSSLECVRHGQYWTRRFPHVEDENVEKIVIKGVKWRKLSSTTLIYPSADTEIGFTDLVDKPRMKMTLEYEKDKP